MQAVGSISGGMAAKSQAKGQAKIARSNALRADRNAIVRGNLGAVNVSRIGRQFQVSTGKMRANIAKAGVEISGSPLAALVAETVTGAVAEMTEAFKTDREVEGFEFQAYNFRANAAAYEAQGKNAMTAGFLNAATAIAGGAYIGTQAGLLRAPIPAAGSVPMGTTFATPAGTPLLY
jgi:hypothetical protein